MTSKLITRSIALLMMSGLASCNFTTTNSLISSHGDDVETYMEDVITDFYAKKTDVLLERFDESINVKSEQLDYLYKLQSDSPNLEDRKVVTRNKTTRNGKTFLTSIYHIPNDVGTEVVTVNVTTPEDKCCDLYGLNLNMQFNQ